MSKPKNPQCDQCRFFGVSPDGLDTFVCDGRHYSNMYPRNRGAVVATVVDGDSRSSPIGEVMDYWQEIAERGDDENSRVIRSLVWAAGKCSKGTFAGLRLRVRAWREKAGTRTGEKNA